MLSSTFQIVDRRPLSSSGMPDNESFRRSVTLITSLLKSCLSACVLLKFRIGLSCNIDICSAASIFDSVCISLAMVWLRFDLNDSKSFIHDDGLDRHLENFFRDNQFEYDV